MSDFFRRAMDPRKRNGALPTASHERLDRMQELH
jgi:hypothetical protein